MASPPALTPSSRPASAEQALRELVLLPEARYEELLAIPAQFAKDVLGGHSASLSRWERDRGLLRTLVNVGELSAAETRFPRQEVYEVANDTAISLVLVGEPALYRRSDPALDPYGRRLLDFSAKDSALSLPVWVDERLWGELWVSRTDDALDGEALATGVTVVREVAGMVAIAERLQRMARLAFEDPLTGVGNRRALDDALHELLADGAPGVTVVMCDIDNLKDLNDDHGHAAGDRAIVATADALATAASAVPDAVTARLGGDEFAVLLVGEQRGTAIALVEAAARSLAAAELPVEVSCGIAVVPSGVTERDALAAADAAQYAAKSRGALLVVASDLPEVAPERRRRRRRTGAGPAVGLGTAQAVCEVVTTLADQLADAPDTPGGRLRWLAERLLVPLDLQQWSLSRVDLVGDRMLDTDSLGLRQTPLTSVPSGDRQVDQRFRLDDFPLSLAAVERDQWFAVAADDPAGDPHERALLHDLGLHHVVALGCRDGVTGWLLELYGRDPRADLRAIGSVLALGASGLLFRPFVPVT